jgi:pimeloyl-ACP methyl ester carboxylesterase
MELASGEEATATLTEGTKPRPRRGWVVLHGVTRFGERHPELQRFVGALATTGDRVLVPHVREWSDLRFAPERARLTIARAIAWLHAHPGTTPGGVVLVGFSFGAPQAMRVAADPKVGALLRGVVGWGGYADIARTFRFSLTGEHDFEGAEYRQPPDPYARWVIGVNSLPLCPSLGRTEALVAALWQLAAAAGERRIRSIDSSSDPMKEELRRGLTPSERALFDVFAPPAGREPDRAEASRLLDELVPAVRRASPTLEVGAGGPLGSPVRLLHARTDRLIPFTETLRLAKTLAPATDDLTTRLIGLFSHSGEKIAAGPLARVRENVRFFEALRGVLSLG